MKTLYLLRHAKSSWEDPALDDHERPLAQRGRKAAPRVGAHLQDAGMVPERVLCSTAVRARETWELVAAELAPTPAVERRREVYDANPASLLMLVRELPETASTAMVVGHNPTLEELAADLASDGDADALAKMKHKYPTAALAEITFRAQTWAEVAPSRGYLARFIKPKELG